MNLELYEVLLKKTASTYSFAKINSALNELELVQQDKPICFLRHDIDFSPVNAVRMAKLEKQYGICSTYTVLLSGGYYNPFEKHVRELFREIKSCGHEVGLHFDPVVHDISDEASLSAHIKEEASALEDLIAAPVSMFSFHNTTDFSMSCRDREYGGLLNAYSNFFHNDVEYTSDSNGYWRFRSWDELLLENHKFIQVLTHPIWWCPKNEFPPFETVVKNLIERFDVGLDEYLQKIKGGWTDVDVIITMPSVMGKLGPLGRVLGPRGLMPNPKTGTVTMDVAKAVTDVKAGKIDFKVDKTGIVHAAIGKVSFDAKKIEENANELIQTIIKLKPTTAKGTYVKSVFMSSTMSPSIPVEVKTV